METTNLQEQERTRIAGHLQEKRGIYQMVLSWKLPDGTRDRKSISTGFPVKGNKKRAESMLTVKCIEMEGILTHRQQEERRIELRGNSSGAPTETGDMLFADFMGIWLESLKPKVKQKKMKMTTFGGYWRNVTSIIAPYFREKGILLEDLTADDINDYYDERYIAVSSSTVEKEHANIHSAIKYALKKKYITRSILDDIERPVADKYKAKFLRQSEAVELFEAIRGHKLELPVILGAFYGLRRSEVVGLKWSAIDFEADTISIEHTVTVTRYEGKNYVIEADSTKSESSLRTLPLVPAFRAKLLEVREEQARYRKLCGNSYDKAEGQYICVNPLGKRIKPDYITSAFPEFMVKNGFRRLRFHDLRHSCASLLLANGVSLKQIQEWLGHSTFAITADIYAHLESNSKLQSAQAMKWIEKTSLSKLPEASVALPVDHEAALPGSLT